MTTTYYQGSIAETVTGLPESTPNDWILELILTAVTQATQATTMSNADPDVPEFQYGAIQLGTAPGSATGTFTIEIEITSGNAAVDCRVRVHRWNSSSQSVSAWTGIQTLAATRLFTLNSVDLGTWASGDWFVVEYEMTATGAHGNESITVGLNTAASEIIAPWTIAGLAYDQARFRWRPDDTKVLSANGAGDWEAAEGVNVSLPIGEICRLRISVEVSGGTPTEGFELWISEDELAYVESADPEHHYSTDIGVTSPGVPVIGCVPSKADIEIADNPRTGGGGYDDLEATTDLLGGTGSFIAGDGCHTHITGTVIFTDPSRTEMEFLIQTFKLSDGRVFTADGTTFDFRLRKDDGTVLDTYTKTPRLTVVNDVGLIGGTTIEQPDRVGPFWDGNGNGYQIAEGSETDALPTLMKTLDRGDTWVEATATGRPATNDWEGCSIAQEGDHILHIGLREGANTVLYHQYKMSSDPSNADTWAVIDQSVDASPGDKLDSSDSISLVYRGGGTDELVIFYAGNETPPASGPSTIWFKTGDPGAWNTRVQLDATGTDDFSAVVAVQGETDIHIAYKDHGNGDLFHKTLTPADVLTADGSRDTLTTAADIITTSSANVIPPVHYQRDPGGADEEIIWFAWRDDVTDKVTAREMIDGTLQAEDASISTDVVTANTQGSVGAAGISLVADAATDTVHAFWFDSIDRRILRTATSVGGAAWSAQSNEYTLPDIHDEPQELTYVRSTLQTFGDGEKVIGLAISHDNGGTGTMRYLERVLVAAGGGSFPAVRRPRGRTLIPV